MQAVGGAAFVVATRCPRCAAPLDFAEGSNAVRCAHCATVLLVTGRRRVLRWVIRPRVSAMEARKIGAFAGGPRRDPPDGRRPDAAVSGRASASGVGARGGPRLVFVPYYRLSAEELLWRRERVPHTREAIDPERPLDEAVRLLRAIGGGRTNEGEYQLDLASRAIERSFLACAEIGGLASWSLGVRTGVLRLELFARDELERDGAVLEPTLTPDAALARALEPQVPGDTVHRDVLRVVPSLVWFPLWVVPVAGRAVTVDGVTGVVVARDADTSVLDALLARAVPPGRAHVVAFRPLCCPNCGWDFAVRAADVVFHCASCQRTWELRGEELEPIASDVVVASAADASTALPRLPVWEVRGVVRTLGMSPPVTRVTLPGRLFAPAFAWRGVDRLCDLGVRLVHGAPASPELEPVKDVTLVGCSLDREDALVLARTVALALLLEDANFRFAIARGRPAPDVAIDDATTRLLWLPFAGDAYSVRDPFTGHALPRRAVEALLADPPPAAGPTPGR